MSRLEDLPNIGKVLADRLRAAGISSEAELMQAGDAEAFLCIRAELLEEACAHTRLALAGAVRRVRWHALDADLRKRLAEEARKSNSP
jgi:DNA transformation protein